MQVRNRIVTTRKKVDRPSMLATLVSFLFGCGMLAVAVWGIGVCRGISRSYGNMAIVAFLSYLVLFVPFAVVGVLVLWSGWNKTTSNWPRRVIWELRDWLTSLSAGEPQHSLEPIDEKTVAQLNSMATNAADLVGTIGGSLLIILGIGGLIVCGVASRQSMGVPFRLLVSFLIGCGAAILGGVSMLRHTRRKSDHEWLIPLRIFTSLVSARVASENARRQQDKSVLNLPPAEPNATHTKKDS